MLRMFMKLLSGVSSFFFLFEKSMSSKEPEHQEQLIKELQEQKQNCINIKLEINNNKKEL